MLSLILNSSAWHGSPLGHYGLILVFDELHLPLRVPIYGTKYRAHMAPMAPYGVRLHPKDTYATLWTQMAPCEPLRPLWPH